MNLETEFRIRRQLQELEREIIHASGELERSNCLTVASAFEPSIWVRLRQRPTPFSADEALLLCQTDGEQWVAWVPDHGEVILRQGEFQPLDEDVLGRSGKMKDKG